MGVDLRASWARPVAAVSFCTVLEASCALTSCLLHLVALCTRRRESVCPQILADVAWVRSVEVAVTIRRRSPSKRRQRAACQQTENGKAVRLYCWPKRENLDVDGTTSSTQALTLESQSSRRATGQETRSAWRYTGGSTGWDRSCWVWSAMAVRQGGQQNER